MQNSRDRTSTYVTKQLKCKIFITIDIGTVKSNLAWVQPKLSFFVKT